MYLHSLCCDLKKSTWAEPKAPGLPSPLLAGSAALPILSTPRAVQKLSMPKKDKLKKKEKRRRNIYSILVNLLAKLNDAPAVTSTDHHTLHLASCLQYLIHCLSFISRLRCLKDILNSSWNLLLQSIELLFIEVQRNSA